MARNEEKAQSMLYRFREAQAAELGLGTRSDRRPKTASACKSLRECERWRGEILREISRKVSKIQDSGLTDYEVRDLNDEINKLLREKRHWENQIIALGGANYRRNVAMLDDDGKEVPGTKGYKYFGRAKELPGVKELFQSKKKEQEEENVAQNFYKKFTNQGPAYFGDLDEQDGKLLEYERAAEEEEWEDAHKHIRTALGLAEDDPIPPLPRPPTGSTLSITDQSNGTSHTDSKRKASDVDTDIDPSTSTSSTNEENGTAPSKRQHVDGSAASSHRNGDGNGNGNGNGVAATPDATALQYARTTAAYIPFLSADDLVPPKMPTQQEMEKFLLELRKKALVEEYFGDQQS